MSGTEELCVADLRPEELIEHLAGELRPVRRLAAPSVRAGLWLALVVVAAGLIAQFSEDFPAWLAANRAPFFMPET